MQKLTNSNEKAYIPKSYIDLYQEKYKKNIPTTAPVPSLPPSTPDTNKELLSSFVGGAKL
jgi:hypothetical protein